VVKATVEGGKGKKGGLFGEHLLGDKGEKEKNGHVLLGIFRRRGSRNFGKKEGRNRIETYWEKEGPYHRKKTRMREGRDGHLLT